MGCAKLEVRWWSSEELSLILRSRSLRRSNHFDINYFLSGYILLFSYILYVYDSQLISTTSHPINYPTPPSTLHPSPSISRFLSEAIPWLPFWKRSRFLGYLLQIFNHGNGLNVQTPWRGNVCSQHCLVLNVISSRLSCFPSRGVSLIPLCFTLVVLRLFGNIPMDALRPEVMVEEARWLGDIDVGSVTGIWIEIMQLLGWGPMESFFRERGDSDKKTESPGWLWKGLSHYIHCGSEILVQIRVILHLVQAWNKSELSMSEETQ